MLAFLLKILFLLCNTVYSNLSYTEDFSAVSPITLCVLNIANKFNGNFLFMSEEKYPIDYELILFNINGTKLIMKDRQFVGNFSGLFILFPRFDEQYTEFLSKLKSSINYYFVLVWPNVNFDDVEFKNLMSQFWKFKLLNVIVLVQTLNSVKVYTYFPYSSSHCNEPGPSVLIDLWLVKEKRFLKGKNLFFETEKLSNFHGCPLQCFAKSRPPDSVIYKMENGTWVLEGTGGKLLKLVQERLNFTCHIVVPKLNMPIDKYGYDISNGIPDVVGEELNNGSIDIAFGIYSHIIYDNPRTDFSIIAVNECFNWAVPISSGEKPSVWKYYTQEFVLPVWILISAQFLICVMFFYTICRLSFKPNNIFCRIDFVALYIFSITLGLSFAPKFKSRKIRLILGPILLYSLIVVSLYQSSLGSFLTIPWKREQIKSYKEILDRNFNIIGIPQANRILCRFSSDNKILKQMCYHFKVHNDYFHKVVVRIQNNRDTATFGAKRFIQFYASNELNGTQKMEVYFMPGCVLQAHSSPFLFRKGSPFTYPINRIVAKALESGLSEVWYLYSTPQINGLLEQIYPLTIHQMKCAFVILVLGNGIATLVFVVEFYYFNKNFYKKFSLSSVYCFIYQRHCKITENLNENLTKPSDYLKY